MKVRTPESLAGGGNFLNQPGTYHCTVLRCVEGQGPKGGVIDGLTAALIVHAGTTKDQQNKTFDLTLFAPNLSHSDNAQAMAMKKLAALALACDLITPANLGQELDVDFTQATGRQIVLTLAHRESDDPSEKKYLELSWADIFHVDDPRVKDVPKDADVLKTADPKCRHDVAYFEAALKKRSDGGQGNGGNGSQQSAQLDVSAI